MGLKITDEINTDKGVTSEAYINIASQSFKKADCKLLENDSFDVGLNLYINEEARVNDPSNTCISAAVPKYLGYSDIGSPSQLEGLKGDKNAFAFAYSLIKESLEERGFTVVDVD